MMRHCDGTDSNLIRKVGDGYEPCACGLTFDDVNHMVIYPHRRLVKDLDELRATIDAMPHGEDKAVALEYLSAREDLVRSGVAR